MSATWSKATQLPRTFECKLCGDEVRVTQVDDRRTVFCCAQHEREYWRHRDRYDRRKNLASGHVVRAWQLGRVME